MTPSLENADSFVGSGRWVKPPLPFFVNFVYFVDQLLREV